MIDLLLIHFDMIRTSVFLNSLRTRSWNVLRYRDWMSVNHIPNVGTIRVHFYIWIHCCDKMVEPYSNESLIRTRQTLLHLSVHFIRVKGWIGEDKGLWNFGYI